MPSEEAVSAASLSRLGAIVADPRERGDVDPGVVDARLASAEELAHRVADELVRRRHTVAASPQLDADPVREDDLIVESEHRPAEVEADGIEVEAFERLWTAAPSPDPDPAEHARRRFRPAEIALHLVVLVVLVALLLSAIG